MSVNPWSLSSLSLLLLIPLPSIAQEAPRPLERPQPEAPRPLPKVAPPAIAPPEAPKFPELPATLPSQIQVLRYEVIGSTVFSSEELSEITKPFTGKVSFDQLQKAAQAITDYYLKRNYPTTGAYVPSGQELKPDNAIVQIQVLEGKLEDIKVTGNQRLKSGYIQSRLARATQAPLNYDRLVESIRLLQQNPLLDQVTAELSAGKQPGTNLLEIKVKESSPLNLQILTENSRSPSIGSWQRRIQASHGNLLGYGDSLSLGYGNTSGSYSFDVGYSLPISPSNTTLSLNFGLTRSNVIESPFNELDIISKSRYYEVTLRQPLFQSAQANQTQELAIGLTGSRVESETSLLDIPFKLSEGADPEGNTRITVLRFFQEYISRNSQQVLSFRSQFNFGLDALGSTINASGPDSRFFSWQGQGRWLRRLGDDFDFIVQTKIQLADRTLPSLEQFSIGGASTVRGYRQDVRTSDNGIYGSVELQIPLWRSRDRTRTFQVTPFTDVGKVWSNDPFTTLNQPLLASTGLGLLWRSNHWTARMDWGIPLVQLEGTKKSLQESGLHLSVRYSF